MNFLISLVLLFNFALSAVEASQFDFQPNSGKVEFKTKGWPNLVVIKGEGQGVTGQLQMEGDTVSGTLTFDLTTLNTGIDLRDDHMKNKYLEVTKHPKAELTLSQVKVPANLAGSFDFTGQLKLHGVEKTVTGKAELDKDGDEVEITANIPVKLSDFKIAIPSYKGITVAEKVTINFESKVKSL